MITKGIRGAITVENNSPEEIEKSTVELLETLLKENNLKEDLISHVIFTLTEDLNADFPAKFARKHFKWNNLAMLCFNELNVPNSLAKCLRVLLAVNCEETFQPKHVYLKGAKTLREDIFRKYIKGMYND